MPENYIPPRMFMVLGTQGDLMGAFPVEAVAKEHAEKVSGRVAPYYAPPEPVAWLVIGPDFYRSLCYSEDQATKEAAEMNVGVPAESVGYRIEALGVIEPKETT